MFEVFEHFHLFILGVECGQVAPFFLTLVSAVGPTRGLVFLSETDADFLGQSRVTLVVGAVAIYKTIRRLHVVLISIDV